jgi:hypothetical protein
MFTHRITIGMAIGSTVLPNQASTYTGSGVQGVSEAIQNTTSYQIAAANFTASTLVECYLLADENVLVKTNSSGSPGNTFSLLAGKPFVWTNDGYFTNPFTTNVTELLILNTSGQVANVTGYFLTP